MAVLRCLVCGYHFIVELRPGIRVYCPKCDSLVLRTPGKA